MDGIGRLLVGLDFLVACQGSCPRRAIGPAPEFEHGRASWSGLLQLSLVTIPVKAYPAASTSQQIHFNQLHAGCGQRIRYEKHCPVHGKVEAGAIVSGYAYAPEQYVVIDQAELEPLRPAKERLGGMAASGLHHEIKNPLTALSIHIQLLEESLSNGQAGEDVEELVGVLKTEICRLNGVLESFRSFANLQHLTIQPTDGLDVVEDVIRLIRPQATEQNVKITLLHPEKKLPAVPLDAEKFEQAVLNLVINALEAMPEGGHLSVSATVANGEFRVSVKDSGPGIPQEVQSNVFQPYFSTKSQGSGMGLALTEKLIGQHGGQINYRTGPEGTTFHISIPLEQRNGSV